MWHAFQVESNSGKIPKIQPHAITDHLLSTLSVHIHRGNDRLTHLWRVSPIWRAVERLGLCRFGVPATLATARKVPRLSSYMATRFARDVAACTSRAATSLSNALPAVSTPHSRRHRLTVGPAHTSAGSQRLRVFRCGTNDSAPLQNSKPLALPVAI
jgi:hypothetical protein